MPLISRACVRACVREGGREDRVYMPRAGLIKQSPQPRHAVADGVTLSFCQQDRGIRVKHGRTEEAGVGGTGVEENGGNQVRVSGKL